MLVKFDPKKWPEPQVIWISSEKERDLYKFRVVVRFITLNDFIMNESGTQIKIPYYSRIINVERCYGEDEMGMTRWSLPSYGYKIEKVVYTNVEPITATKIISEINYYLNSIDTTSRYILHAVADALGIPERIEIPNKN